MKSWEVIHGRIFVLFFPLSALKLTAALRRREKPSPHPAEPCMDELNDFYSSTQPRFTCNTARSSESTTVGIDYQHLGILFVWSRTGSMVEHPPANAGDLGSIPGSGRFPRKGNGNPLHCSCLGNPMDRGAWWATVQGISTESDSTEPEWLNNNTSAYLINLLLQLSRHCCCCCWAASVVSDSVRPHRRQPTRLLCPWDPPSKNTGVGCHFLLQCVKVKSLSHVRLLATPWTAAYQGPPSMDFPGKSTGVGCHCLLRVNVHWNPNWGEMRWFSTFFPYVYKSYFMIKFNHLITSKTLKNYNEEIWNSSWWNFFGEP